MSFALIDRASVSGGVMGATATSSVNSTGTDLAVFGVGWYVGGGTTPAPEDSNVNTWVFKKRSLSVSSAFAFDIYECRNPIVGSGHTFKCPGVGGTGHYPAVLVLLFSGSKTSAEPYDTDNINSADGISSVASGSVTPTENGELIVNGLVLDTAISSLTFDSGVVSPAEVFVNFSTGNNMGGAMTWKEQITAAAINVTASWTTASNAAALISTFKAPSALTSTFPALSVQM